MPLKGALGAFITLGQRGFSWGRGGAPKAKGLPKEQRGIPMGKGVAPAHRICPRGRVVAPGAEWLPNGKGLTSKFGARAPKWFGAITCNIWLCLEH